MIITKYIDEDDIKLNIVFLGDIIIDNKTYSFTVEKNNDKLQILRDKGNKYKTIFQY